MRVIGVLHTFYWYNYAKLGKGHNYFPRNDFFIEAGGGYHFNTKQRNTQTNNQKGNLGDALEIAFFIIGQAGPAMVMLR